MNALNFKEMYEGDFFLTWEKTDDELMAVGTLADALRYMRENNMSTKVLRAGWHLPLPRQFHPHPLLLASACISWPGGTGPG